MTPVHVQRARGVGFGAVDGSRVAHVHPMPRTAPRLTRRLGLGAALALSVGVGGCLAGGEVEFQDRIVWPGSVPCVESSETVLLPDAVRESSGLALASYRLPPGDAAAAGPPTDPAGAPPTADQPSGDRRLFWTHNDSGHDPELFLVDAQGTLHARIPVTGAQNVDWEDMASGACPVGVGGAEGGAGREGGREGGTGIGAGPGTGTGIGIGAGTAIGPGTGTCLYIADVGDNLERRQDAVIYRVREPAWGDTVSAPAEAFPLRLPVGPRDIEAMALLPDETILLITKGRNHGIEVLRVPGPLGIPGERIRVEMVQALSERPPNFMGRITGASASPDGSVVAIRSYEALTFHRVGPSDTLEMIRGGTVNLRPLREPQGEAVLLLDNGEVWLTSETGPMRGGAVMSGLQCTLPSG